MTMQSMKAKMTAPNPWRVVATLRPLGVAVLAGIVATHIATIFGFWFHGLGLPNLDWPRFNGYLIFRAALGGDPTVVFTVPDFQRLVVGWIAHSFTGVVFAAVFVAAIHPMLPWRNTVVGNLTKALVWGAVLATLSALWWVPALFPEFDLGFFSWNVPERIAPAYANWQGVFGIYLWHFIWGFTLGTIFNPLPADETPAMST